MPSAYICRERKQLETAIVAKKFGIFLFKAGLVLNVLYVLAWFYAHSNPGEYGNIIPLSEALEIGAIPTIAGAVCAVIF